MDQNTPDTVSVVIPAHNAEKTLGICLEHIRNGIITPDEVIVVDDNSTDNTVGIAKKHGARVFEMKGCTYGPGYCRNLGARKSSGSIIAFLDSDTRPARDWLSTIKKEMTLGVDGIGGRYILDLENCDHKWFNRVFTLWEEVLFTHFKRDETCNHLTGGNCAYRREAWHSVTRSYDETRLFKGMASGEDYFISEEISLAHTLKYSDKIAVTHMTDYYPRFFRRSTNQGFSRMTNVLYRFLGEGRNKSAGLVKHNQGVVQASRIGSFAVAYFCILSCFAMLYIQKYLFSGILFVSSSGIFLYGMVPYFKEIRRSRIKKSAYVTAIYITLMQQAGWGIGMMKALLHPLKMKLLDFKELAMAFWRFKVSGEVAKMFFLVTPKCNSGSPGCLDNPLKNKESTKEVPGELSIDEIRTMCERSNIILPYVVIAGGEPFLRKDIDQIAYLISNNLKTKYITIITNGSRYDIIEEQLERILISCPLLRVNVQMTVADLDEKLNHIRQHKGSYKKLIDLAYRIHALKNRFLHLTFSISTQLSDDNVTRYREIIDGVKTDFNPDEHVVSLIRKVTKQGSPPDESLNYLSEMVTYAQDRYKEGQRSGLFQFEHPATVNASWDIYKAVRSGKCRYHPCMAARKFITLYEDGKVTACENRTDFFLGKLQDSGYRLDVIMHNEKTHKIQQVIRDTRCQCDRCCIIHT